MIKLKLRKPKVFFVSLLLVYKKHQALKQNVITLNRTIRLEVSDSERVYITADPTLTNITGRITTLPYCFGCSMIATLYLGKGCNDWLLISNYSFETKMLAKWTIIMFITFT